MASIAGEIVASKNNLCYCTVCGNKKQGIGGRSLARRLLLRQTVQRPQAPDQLEGVNADHFSPGKEIGQDAQGQAVVGVVEGRHQSAVSGDLEVGVATRTAA